MKGLDRGQTGLTVFLEVTMTEKNVILDISTQRRAELEVLFQEEVQLDINVPLFYIKSGEEDINNYVERTAKPAIDAYVEEKNGALEQAARDGVEAIGEAQEEAKSGLEVYVDGTVKPVIDTYAETAVKPELQSFADELKEAFDTNATEKTAAVNALAEQAEASASSAASSSSAAQTAASAAAENAAAASSAADTAEIWAVGSIEEQPAGSAKYWAEKISPENLLPVGMILAWPGTKAPSGWLNCDGSVVSRTTYADLFSVIGTTFGAGDGSTTFKLPDYRGDFLRGYLSGTSSAIGTRQAEGLPNISGRLDFGKQVGGMSSSSGAFSHKNISQDWAGTSTGTVNVIDYVNFDASRSSGLYGDSSHVTPRNNAVSWCIKY